MVLQIVFLPSGKTTILVQLTCNLHLDHLTIPQGICSPLHLDSDGYEQNIPMPLVSKYTHASQYLMWLWD